MSIALVLNLIPMAIVLVSIVGMHHWAIRTQHHDPHFLSAAQPREGQDRRGHRASDATDAERRQGNRRAGRPVTA